jgi:hypothetical protein
MKGLRLLCILPLMLVSAKPGPHPGSPGEPPPSGRILAEAFLETVVGPAPSLGRRVSEHPRRLGVLVGQRASVRCGARKCSPNLDPRGPSASPSP